MGITFICECGTRLHAKHEQAGNRAKCPSCGKVARVPSARFDRSHPAESSGSIPLDEVVVQCVSGAPCELDGPDDREFSEVERRASDSETERGIDPGPIQTRSPSPSPAPPPLIAVSTPSFSDPSLSREPWFYLFLDRYATVATRTVKWASIAILCIGVLCYLYQLYSVLSIHVYFKASFGTLIWSSGLVAFWFRAGLVGFLLLFLVPVLFALALIQVVADAHGTSGRSELSS
jgi:hypothetical protein